MTEFGVENSPANQTVLDAILATGHLDGMLLGRNNLKWSDVEETEDVYTWPDTEFAKFDRMCVTWLPRSGWGCEHTDYGDDIIATSPVTSVAAYKETVAALVARYPQIEVLIVAEEVEGDHWLGTEGQYEETLDHTYDAVDGACEVWHSGTNRGTYLDSGIPPVDLGVWYGGTFDVFPFQWNRGWTGGEHFYRLLKANGIERVACGDAASVNAIQAGENNYLSAEDIQVLQFTTEAHYRAHQPRHVAKMCAVACALGFERVLFTTFVDVPASPWVQIKYGGMIEDDLSQRPALEIAKFFDGFPTGRLHLQDEYVEFPDGDVVWAPELYTGASSVEVTDLLTMEESTKACTAGKLAVDANAVWWVERKKGSTVSVARRRPVVIADEAEAMDLFLGR